MTEPTNETRDRYPHFLAIPTRWIDNDIYGHVNNVRYYEYFDTVINRYLIEAGGLDIGHTPELDSRDREMLTLIHKRNRIMSDAWLTNVGHKRPGMEKGLPLAEAMEKAEVLKNEINKLSQSKGR